MKTDSLRKITFELFLIRSVSIIQNTGDAGSPDRRDTQEHLVKITLDLKVFTLRIKLLLGSWFCLLFTQHFNCWISRIAGFKIKVRILLWPEVIHEDTWF